jgi:hypothetical protein
MSITPQSVRASVYGQATPTVRKHWTDDETNQLLALIKNKKPLELIAATHVRTVTSIKQRLQKLANDFHTENKSMAMIQKLTGLTEAEIDRAINKRRVIASSVPSTPAPEQPTMKDVMNVLLTLQDRVKRLVPDEPEPTLHDVMRVVNDIQNRMDKLINTCQ